MNKIFKVIWSKARNCYVVVSELAKSHDDGHVRRSRSGCCRKAAVLAAWVLTMGVNGAALAKENVNVVVDDKGNLVVEDKQMSVNGKGNIIYGTGNTVETKDDSNNGQAVVIGIANKTDANAVNSIVIGNNSNANVQNSIVIGNHITNNSGNLGGVVIIGNQARAESDFGGWYDNAEKKEGYHASGLILGEYSYSSRRAGRTGYVPGANSTIPTSSKPTTTIPSIPSDVPQGAYTSEYWNAVWTATANPLSIGDVDDDGNGKGEAHNAHGTVNQGIITRQITGVAAGSANTDAVNVAQLRAVNDRIDQINATASGVHYYSVKSTDETVKTASMVLMAKSVFPEKMVRMPFPLPVKMVSAISV